MSAIEGNDDGPIDIIQVLFALYPSFGAQDLCGPFEVLNAALHNSKDPGNTFLLTSLNQSHQSMPSILNR